MKTTEPMAAKAEEFLLKITHKTPLIKKKSFLFPRIKKKKIIEKINRQKWKWISHFTWIQQSGEKKINNAGENPINGLNFFRGPVSMAEKLLKYSGFTWENFWLHIHFFICSYVKVNSKALSFNKIINFLTKIPDLFWADISLYFCCSNFVNSILL